MCRIFYLNKDEESQSRYLLSGVLYLVKRVAILLQNTILLIFVFLFYSCFILHFTHIIIHISIHIVIFAQCCPIGIVFIFSFDPITLCCLIIPLVPSNSSYTFQVIHPQGMELSHIKHIIWNDIDPVNDFCICMNFSVIHTFVKVVYYVSTSSILSCNS